MREYIRHPSSIPLEVKIDDLSDPQSEYLNNVSMGGLSFHSKNKLDDGALIILRIPLLKESIQIKGKVVWCRKQGRGYEVGVTFRDREEAFRTRMIEQICHIEQYRSEVREREHRELTSEQAAIEWIKKFADSFPELMSEE
jgi:Tfp pilus assembly protein PilZ